MDTLTIDETVKLLINLYSTWKTWDIERKVSFIKMAAVKLEVNKEKCLQIQQKEVFEHLFWLWNLKWLPLADLFRTKYREDISNLGRLFECNRGIRELLLKSRTPVLK